MKRLMKRIPHVLFSMFILTGALAGCGDDDPKDPVDAAIPDGDTPDALTPDGDVEDGAVDPGEKPLGSWMNVFEEPVLGPNDIPAEAVVFDIDNSEIAMVFYMGTVQVTGAKGHYEMQEEEDNSFVVTLTHLWEPSEMDWVELPEPFVKPHPYTFDETTLMAMSPDGDEIPTVKTEFFQFADLQGQWVYSEGTNDIVLVLGAEAVYTYEQTGDDFGNHSEEGTWSSTGDDTGYLRTQATKVNEVSPVSLEALTEYEITEDNGDAFLTLYYPDGEGGLFPVTLERSHMGF